MLSVEALTVDYGSTRAVDGVSIHVDPGEAVALLGPNGAGKTSTLRAVSGLVARAGHVEFDGNGLDRLAPDTIARLGLVHVPEGRHVFPTLSVRDNLLVGRSARAGRPSSFELDEVVDLFPKMAGLLGRESWTLSGGEQQMLVIGRALMASPRMLMLDEPSLGLAPVVVHDLIDALADIRRHVPVLMVEQNTSVALQLCDRAYVLAEGKIAIEGPADALGDRRELISTYLGRRTADPDQASDHEVET